MFASTFMLDCAVCGMPCNGPYLTPTDDPYLLDDLQAAQRLVDYWFQTERQQP
ncbi:hypothetical protein [Paraburkholderia caledonica]|uniref:Uncharacterized protein n=1 Tax=Paraburkholderia caledonica TaxID=134536 RepID=A0AB73IP33_9BURK|nr:hypothetical protein [Paraburkholderia caledonica]